MNSELRAENKIMSAENFFQLSLIIIISMALFLPYLDSTIFIDEYDNLIGGVVVGNGGEIYKDFYSQHTPIMYYLMGLFYYLGANNIQEFRLGLYFVMTVGFCFLHLRYSKDFNGPVFILFPIIYIVSLVQIDNVSHTVISEHLQSFSIIVIFLEILRAERTEELNFDSIIVLALFSFTSIGVAFISIYPVAWGMLVVGLFGIGLVHSNHLNPSRINKEGLLKIIQFIVVVAVPFIMFGVWYGLKGNIENFYVQAYWLNREVYSKYIAGGVGGDVFSPILNSLNSYIKSIFSIFEYKGALVLEVPRACINTLINIIFMAYCLKRGLFIFIVVFVFVALNTIRGEHGFHSLPYWATTALMASILLSALHAKNYLDNTFIRSVINISLIIPIAFFILRGYVDKVDGARNQSQEIRVFDCKQIIDTLLSPNEKFYSTSVDPEKLCYIESKRMPAIKAYSIVPWGAEIFEDEIINGLAANKPKLIIHNPKNEVWGYVLESYAPKLNSYIQNNYRELDIQVRDIYVLNEYFDDAIVKLIASDPDYYGNRVGLNLLNMNSTTGELLPNYLVSQSFKAEMNNLKSVSILFGTYKRVNHGNIKISLRSSAGVEIFSEYLDTRGLVDNKFYEFKFPEINNSLGKMYSIELVSMTGLVGEVPTIWKSVEDVYSDGVLYEGGRKMSGDLSIKISYKR